MQRYQLLQLLLLHLLLQLLLLPQLTVGLRLKYCSDATAQLEQLTDAGSV